MSDTNILKPRTIEPIKEKPEEKIDTKQPEGSLDGDGMGEDPRYYTMLKHFDIEKPDPEQTEKLKIIWEWVRDRSPLNNINETDIILQRLQSELGVPPMNMDKIEHE